MPVVPARLLERRGPARDAVPLCHNRDTGPQKRPLERDRASQSAAKRQGCGYRCRRVTGPALRDPNAAPAPAPAGALRPPVPDRAPHRPLPVHARPGVPGPRPGRAGAPVGRVDRALGPARLRLLARRGRGRGHATGVCRGPPGRRRAQPLLPVASGGPRPGPRHRGGPRCGRPRLRVAAGPAGASRHPARPRTVAPHGAPQRSGRCRRPPPRGGPPGPAAVGSPRGPQRDPGLAQPGDARPRRGARPLVPGQRCRGLGRVPARRVAPGRRGCAGPARGPDGRGGGGPGPAARPRRTVCSASVGGCGRRIRF